jgi:hypothetical protein
MLKSERILCPDRLIAALSGKTGGISKAHILLYSLTCQFEAFLPLGATLKYQMFGYSKLANFGVSLRHFHKVSPQECCILHSCLKFIRSTRSMMPAMKAQATLVRVLITPTNSHCTNNMCQVSVALKRPQCHFECNQSGNSCYCRS